MRTCAGCGRQLGKAAARCIYCGTVASDAPPPAPAAASAKKPVLVQCPGCLRNVRVAPGATGACSFCALGFAVDDAGAARIARAASAAPATRADVARLVAELPAARLWDLVRDVLLRRADADELGAGEAERAINALTAIAAWRGTSPRWLPLSLDEANALVPRVLFGFSDGARFREDNENVLVVTLGTRPRVADDYPMRTIDGVGPLSALDWGHGRAVPYPGQVETDVRMQIRMTLDERHGGVELLTVANQDDQNRPTALSGAQATDLQQRITASRKLLIGYYVVGALFGPSCRGGTAFSITRDAIAQRLAMLGCTAAPDLVDQLCVRPPPPFKR